MKTIYNDFEEYGSPIDCCWKPSCMTIELKVKNNPEGWTVNVSDCEVNYSFFKIIL